MLQRLLNRLLIWLRNHISNRNFLILASIVVGIVSALAAILLKAFVNWMRTIVEYFSSKSDYNLWFFFLPLAGIIITVLIIKFFFKDKLEKGLGSILYAISRKSARVEKSKMYSHVITSGVTVGLGGSAGLEAPIVVTGSAIGSNIATLFHLGYKERALLLACGAAAGIAAVFNSPIAGVVFALEVLLAEISIPVFIPILISAATSIIVSKLLSKGQLFQLIVDDWIYQALPFYVFLGLACGLLSVYITRTTLFVEAYFNAKKSAISKILTGGLTLGALIFIFPPLFGEGYDVIKVLLQGNYGEILNFSIFAPLKDNGWVILVISIAVILLKVIASALTIGAGGNGGIFAPSLFTGGLMGFSLAYFVNLTGISSLKTNNFIVVGMAGVLSGVVHAPLTSIFLIAEITGGYVLFVPLMIVSATSYFIGKYFEPYSVYTKKLAQGGDLLLNDKDYNILYLLRIDDLLETDFIRIKSSGTLRNVIEAFSKSNRNIYPVVDEKNNLVGIVRLENVKHLLFQSDLYDITRVIDIAEKDFVCINKRQNMELAMKTFEDSKLMIIPVVDNQTYLGFISRANIFSAYRRLLKQSSSLV